MSRRLKDLIVVFREYNRSNLAARSGNPNRFAVENQTDPARISRANAANFVASQYFGLIGF